MFSLRTRDHSVYHILIPELFISRRESRSLSELTRQITPPTKNGHAPPSTKSSKSSQSDLPIRCSGLVRFPVLSQIKPQAPRLVVPFRQFLQVSALQPYSPRNRIALTSRSEGLPIRCRLSGPTQSQGPELTRGNTPTDRWLVSFEVRSRAVSDRLPSYHFRS